MASLKKSDVLHVAELSHLKLSEAEIKKLTPQLSKIVEFIGSLNEVDTSDVEPVSQVTGLFNVYREDIVRVENILPKNKTLSGTDDVHNGLFKVKAILSERSDK